MLVFITLVIVFYRIQVITKSGKTYGKRLSAWDRWNRQLLPKVFCIVDSRPPNSFWPYQKLSEGYSFFFWKVLFILLISYFMSPGGSYRDNTGAFQWKVTLWQGLREMNLICANRLIIIIALGAGLNTFILYCILLQRTYLAIFHINQGVKMFHRWGGCGKHWASLRERRGRCWFSRRDFPSIFNWLLKITILATKRNTRRTTAAWFSIVCTVSFSVCLYLCLILLSILANFS